MSREVWSQTLYQQRRALLGWVLGIAGVSVMYAGFYPAVSAPEFTEAYASMPSGVVEAFGMQDLTTAAGYLGSTVYGILGPVLVMVFAIGWGARFIAGDEQSGVLDLLLAHPVSRPSVLLQRTLTLVLGLLALGITVVVAVFLVSGPADLDLGVGQLAAASLHLVALGLAMGAVTLAIGAATGSKAAAIGGGAVVAVLSWMANALAPQAEALSWLTDVSPFAWYAQGQPLVSGVQWGDVGLLVGLAAVAVAVGLALFRRRDLMV
ncbi:MAG TPA: ABC transporter permease subunit [Jiangellales bacterium]|nr:ABC transporter permease subunit [Jiangellales bacterium]